MIRPLVVIVLALAAGCREQHTAAHDLGGAADAQGFDDAGPPAPHCAVSMNTPSSLCATTAASCPVLVDATLTCDQYGRSSSVAAGSGLRGYVMLATAEGELIPHLFTIDPAGSGVADVPPTTELVLTDSNGTPSLVGADATAPAGWPGVIWFTQDRDAWVSEPVALQYSRPPWCPFAVFDGAIASSGERHLLLDDACTPASPYPTLYFATPSTPGQEWSRTAVQPMDVLLSGGFALDGGDLPYAVFWGTSSLPNGKDLFYRAGTAPPQTVFHDSNHNGNGTSLAIAVGGGNSPGMPTLAAYVDDGDHLLIPVNGTYQDNLLPAPSFSGCPQLTPGSTAPCADGAQCTVLGSGAYGTHSLGRTADGVVWFAWSTRDWNTDYVLSRNCASGPSCICSGKVLADHSTAAVHLARVSSTGTSDLRLDVPLDFVDPSDLHMAVLGQQIYLAIGDGSAARVRYFLLDATKL